MIELVVLCFFFIFLRKPEMELAVLPSNLMQVTPGRIHSLRPCGI